MPAATADILAAAISSGRRFIGQIAIATRGDGFVLCHRDDDEGGELQESHGPEKAIEIARFDKAGNFRPLKTAPNLRRGWRLHLANRDELDRALDCFYPGRIPALIAWNESRLSITPLRRTLERQSGMYRAAAKISDDQINETVGRFCRSDGGCLRTILWRRDAAGAVASTLLPAEKFNPAYDQTGQDRDAIPLLCQEACLLLVNECRTVVKDKASE